jgi:hypothetical protein
MRCAQARAVSPGKPARLVGAVYQVTASLANEIKTSEKTPRACAIDPSKGMEPHRRASTLDQLEKPTDVTILSEAFQAPAG